MKNILYVYSYQRTCAAYDSTVKAMGFDEVRVKYRQERRTVVREVILRKLIGKDMKEFVETEAQKRVPQKSMIEFMEDILDDLEQFQIDDNC